MANRDSEKESNRPIRILFNVCADGDSYNAQSLNAREIALRLDPSCFKAAMFFERSPDARLSRAGIQTVKLPTRRRTPRILREMLGSYDFIVYLDLGPASYLYVHLPRVVRCSTKTVVCVEGTRGNLDAVAPRVRKYAEYVLRHADVKTAISEFVAQDTWEAFGVKPDMLMPVGVDRKVFSPPAERRAGVPTVLFVGHLIERKGPQVVLDAAARFPQAQFRIVGSVRDEFGRELVRRYQEVRPANVRIDGVVSQAELAQVMRDSDIFLLPSRIEGMPKVTLEAAASGLPCVVFNDYKSPSVVDGVTGFQVSTLDEMLHRLQRLIEDSGLRNKMGAAAAVHAEQYDWDRVAAQWTAMFQRLAPPRR